MKKIIIIIMISVTVPFDGTGTTLFYVYMDQVARLQQLMIVHRYMVNRIILR